MKGFLVSVLLILVSLLRYHACNILRKQRCYSSAWQTSAEPSKTSNPLTFGFPKLKFAAEVCTLGLSPKNPGWCCWVWAAVKLLLLCSIASAPHPSCLSCGLVSHTRDPESGLLNLPLTLAGLPAQRESLHRRQSLASFCLNIGQRTSDDITGLSMGLLRSLGRPGLLRGWRWHCSAQHSPCTCVLLVMSSAGSGRTTEKKKKREIIEQIECVRKTTSVHCMEEKHWPGTRIWHRKMGKDTL